MIVAPSGAGKSSLVNALLKDDAGLKLSLSSTTRAPRPGEVDGKDYFFYSNEEFDKAIDSEVQKIQIERRKMIGVNTVLIFQAKGDIVVSLNETVTNLDRCTIAFDAFDKDAAKQVHQSNMEAMKVAISLERDSHMGFVNLADGVFLLDDEEKPIYSFSISASAEISLSSALTSSASCIDKQKSTGTSFNKSSINISASLYCNNLHMFL